MTQTKTFPYQWLTIGITIFVMLSGWVAIAAVQGEKIKQMECKATEIVKEQNEFEKDNSADHKKIMEGIIRIETLISTRGYGLRR